jgi:two-component system, cell cycle sensor histidine kinase and response regulator CckA
MDATVLFVATAARADQMNALIALANVAGIEVKLRGDDLSQALATYARMPRVVIAVVAETQTEATFALGVGADEAMTVQDAFGVSDLILLVDRARARAQGRALRDTLRDTVVHAEKLRALGTVVAGVAHEVNNPLAAMSLSLEQLRANVEPLIKGSKRVFALAAAQRPIDVAEMEAMSRLFNSGAPDGESEQIFDELMSCVDTIADVVRDLAVFSRVQDSERRELIHLPRVIDQVLRIVGRDLRQRARIEREFIGEELVVAGSRARLVQVFSNLIINATQAIREADRGEHRLRVCCRADETSILISFTDTGVGIRGPELERIFDTFYTTKGEGTGLGLSISRAIMRSLGGELLAESVYGEGATFICILPRASETELALLKPRPQYGQRPAPQVRVSLMLIDPDSRVLRSLPRVLRDDYDVITAGDAQEAIELLQSGSNPSAILSELDLPELSASGFWQWMSAHRPNLCAKTVFFTSPTVAREHADFIASLPNAVLEKPFARDALTQALERLRPS